MEQYLDTDDKVKIFNDNLQKLFGECVPLKRSIKNSNVPKWFNNAISRAIDDREIARRIFRRNKTIENQRIYRRLRNKVCLLIRSAKKKFWESQFMKNQSSKRLWYNISEMGLSDGQNLHCLIRTQPMS